MADDLDRSREVTLADLVDQLAGAGVAVSGDVTIGIAGVDLIYVGLRTLLASVGTMVRLQEETHAAGPALARSAPRARQGGSGSSRPAPNTGLEALEAAAAALERSGLFPRHVDADPDSVEQGLGRLVLTLVELLRQLMEKQAMRRIDAGGLTEDQVERMGQTLLRLEQKMEELKESFGLAGEDLTLTLGPLGDLL